MAEKTRITFAVTVEVDSDWADPWNAARHLLDVAISGDHRGISLPHDVSCTGTEDPAIDGAVTSIATVSEALRIGTLRIITAPSAEGEKQ
ncbi:hypothetical protein [Rhodococcus sp. Leaf233]|uniref:hypothetical protein n=1 Tax=Rhodococcus sp. Leaf233 TaxID=1736302 RepID=UPI0007093B8E|nr:hypothetical protein [Rhodococcus sp. Leaf233]KQU33548.1 hypothetical protein ASH04_06855 [Rhodococcus sp. Leaf233]